MLFEVGSQISPALMMSSLLTERAKALLKTSPLLAKAHAAVRNVSPKVEQDRMLAQDFAEVAKTIAAGKIADAAD